jgi:Mg2+/Co2+ transporter CorB
MPFLDELPLSFLFGCLAFLVLSSAFFSGSETGLMSLNRYRLRAMADQQHKGALSAMRLLSRPERLIGVILLGNNLVNYMISVIATIIGLRLYGETGVAVMAVIMIVVILLFAEVTPKTLAALHPERFALPASHVLAPLLRLFYPFVWIINKIASGIFRVLGISQEQQSHYDLNTDELRIVVNEAGTVIPQRHQQMLLNILDLEKVTVEDIMVPRNEIIGIDLHDEWATVYKQLRETVHTRLPVYEGDINHVVGLIHMRNVLKLFETPEKHNHEALRSIMREPYFVPEGTPLNKQLLNFQHERRRIGLVVDEYGDIQGLVTLEDLLEEIVGEFTTDPAASSRDIHLQEDGTYLVDGSSNVRELNRLLEWDLPTDGPKTLNGLVIEYLEHIPEVGTSLLLGKYPIEIVSTTQHAVKTVRVDPDWQQRQEAAEERDQG